MSYINQLWSIHNNRRLKMCNEIAKKLNSMECIINMIKCYILKLSSITLGHITFWEDAIVWEARHLSNFICAKTEDGKGAYISMTKSVSHTFKNIILVEQKNIKSLCLPQWWANLNRNKLNISANKVIHIHLKILIYRETHYIC